jgi:hypothetical protein
MLLDVSMGCHLVASIEDALNSSSNVHCHGPPGEATGGAVPEQEGGDWASDVSESLASVPPGAGGDVVAVVEDVPVDDEAVVLVVVVVASTAFEAEGCGVTVDVDVDVLH